MQRFLTSIKYLLTQPFTNSIFVFSAIMSIIGISYMIKIISNPFSLGFTISDIEMSNYNEIDKLAIIGNFEMIAHLIQDYTFYQSINIWLWVTVLLFDYTFVGELALILEVINSALFDIIFFILMFFKVLFEEAIFI